MKLNFVTKTRYGSNFGSRIYMLDDSDNYKIFKLKNRDPCHNLRCRWMV